MFVVPSVYPEVRNVFTPALPKIYSDLASPAIHNQQLTLKRTK